MAPKAKRARIKAPEPPPACLWNNLNSFSRQILRGFAITQKRVLYVPYKAVWRWTLDRVMREVKFQREKRHVEAERKRQDVLYQTWYRKYEGLKKSLVSAFRNHKPAMRWVRTTLAKVKVNLNTEYELEARRCKTCLCGGSITSNWTSECHDCRACNLGCGGPCSCEWTRWEVLSCSECQKPERGLAPAVKPRCTQYGVDHAKYAASRWPRLWARYQKSLRIIFPRQF
jgi:hypothetical protein